MRLFLPSPLSLWVFYLLGLGEMLVPAYAERAAHGGGTPWHPGHIAERYGLFTLIVLGECIAAVTVALHSASLTHGISAGLVAVVAGAVLLVFAIWWWYFENPAEEGLRMSRQLSFVWGYGHYFVFASLAALGAGLQLAAASSHGALSSTAATTAGLAVAVPVVAYLVVTGVLQARLGSQWPGRVTVVCAASAVVLLLGGLAHGLGVGAVDAADGRGGGGARDGRRAPARQATAIHSRTRRRPERPRTRAPVGGDPGARDRDP